VPSDLQLALKHKYVSSPGGKPNINVTSIAKLIDDGKSSAFAGSAVKITRAGGDYRAEWEASGARGTRVHRHFDRYLRGLEIDMLPEDKPLVLALEKFLIERDPEPMIEPEFVVVCEVLCPVCGQYHGYGGRGDVALKIAGERWLIDLKTGKRYAVEHMLQLAALRYGRLAVYDEAGALVETRPMPAFDRTGDLYVTDEGEYELVEYPAGPDAYNAFLSLLHAYSWTRTPEITKLRNAWRKAA